MDGIRLVRIGSFSVEQKKRIGIPEWHYYYVIVPTTLIMWIITGLSNRWGHDREMLGIMSNNINLT